MTQPMSYGGRPPTPAPGTSAPELLIAKIRTRAPGLFFSAVLFVGICAAGGYFYGNLPEPLEDWMLLTAAAVAIFFVVFLPFLSWRAHTYTVTTRRIIERTGVFVTRRRELTHVRGYTVQLRRGPLQRLVGSGTLTLTNGIDLPIRISRVPRVALLHEVLIDQIEVNQILAHRDGQATTIEA